jgi:hypothetical protein
MKNDAFFTSYIRSQREAYEILMLLTLKELRTIAREHGEEVTFDKGTLASRLSYLVHVKAIPLSVCVMVGKP